MSWRLSGLENLGDDFSVTTDSGVIEPKSEFALNAHFRAMKSINLKKMIRLEVSRYGLCPQIYKGDPTPSIREG